MCFCMGASALEKPGWKLMVQIHTTRTLSTSRKTNAGKVEWIAPEKFSAPISQSSEKTIASAWQSFHRAHFLCKTINGIMLYMPSENQNPRPKGPAGNIPTKIQ